MKSNSSIKKVISLLLSLILIFTVAIPAFATPQSCPTIVIGGRRKSLPIYSTNGERINDTAVSNDYIINAVKACLPELAKARITGDYQPWIDKFIEYYAPIYEKMLPDKNGEITDGSAPKNASDARHTTPGYNGYDFKFVYDWRLDPYTRADKLHENIQRIKSIKNVDKVNVISRCYGGCIVGAYIDKYGTEDINALGFDAVSTTGAAAAGCAFTGKLNIDTKAFQNYLETNEGLTGDPDLDDLILCGLRYINSFYIKTGEKGTLTTYERKLYKKAAPQLLRLSFARYASMWAMVSEEYFDDAKAFVFDTDEVRAEYASLIEKIDRYHNLRTSFREKLKAAADSGVNVAVFTRYNRVLSPIVDNPKLQADDTVELISASFGATCSQFGKTLSVSDGRYVSSDKIVDASTCLFPDKTWFIKDMPHSEVCADVDRMMIEIMNGGTDYTIDTNEKYPQFLKWNTSEKAISPLDDAPKAEKSKNFIEKIVDLFDNFALFTQSIMRYISALFNKNVAPSIKDICG